MEIEDGRFGYRSAGMAASLGAVVEARSAMPMHRSTELPMKRREGG